MDVFIKGFEVIIVLSDGIIFFCFEDGVLVSGGDIVGVEVVVFFGLYLVGFVGMYIYFLYKFDLENFVWIIGY